MTKAISTGIENFKNIIENNYYFVDKSLFIKDVIDNANAVCLITRPRRFGKTLNLNMLKYFFDITLDSKELFKDLKIMNQDEKYTSKMNKYPVIFLTLKGLQQSNYEDSLVILKSEISSLFSEYTYLLESDKINEQEKLFINRAIKEELKPVELTICLKNLSLYLNKHYETEVIMLLDEYDVPLQNAYVNGYYSEAIIFWKSFFNATFKTNFNLYKTVLTGVSRVAKESIFSGANNFDVYSVLSDKEFSSHFGFTETEVIEMLENFNMLEHQEEVKTWYDGYKIGSTPNLYNPWSVINYIKTKELIPYWVNTSSNDLIKMILKKNQSVKEKVENLFNGNTIDVTVNEETILDNIEENEDNIWGLFISTGYIRIIEQIDRKTYKVDLPNEEIKCLFEDIAINWFKGILNSQDLTTITNYLIKQDYESFIITFKELVKEMFSSWDVGFNTSENFYHAFVLGLLVSLKNKYIIKSNKESGFGRYDIILKPIDKNNPAFIIEFKVVRDTFEKSIVSAKKQIEDKAYETELISEEYQNIEKMVFAFQGKNVEIEVF